MNYRAILQRFITSQYFFHGFRITAGVIIPAFALYYYDLLLVMMALPMGALCVSLTDNPGPLHHRRNSLAASLVINIIVVLITGLVYHQPILIIACIVLFGMFFSLIGVYGNRVSSIGLIALIVFTFNSDGHLETINLWQTILWFAVGGIWYIILSLFLHTLQPYKFIQQLMGESLMETSDYLRVKGKLYSRQPDYTALYNRLIELQVKIHQHQDDLREMLFKTRTIIEDSTVKGRILMMMFLDSVDLLESIMTSQHNYQELHDEFDGMGILETYQTCIEALANELFEIGLAIQTGLQASQDTDIDVIARQPLNAFLALRKEKLSPDTIEQFIKLRQILYSIQDVAERIKRLRSFTGYDKKVIRSFKGDIKPDKDVEHTEINPQLLIENLSLSSNHFRHAVRVTVALLAGYIISLFFPLGHSYWILLTIVTILKPAYSLSKQRNIQRVAGTVVGILIGFGILYLVKDRSALFIIMIIAMVLSYSFIKTNYFVGTAGVTIYVLISFHFLSSTSFQTVISDRIIDTIIGCAIAFICSFFVLPSWGREQINTYIIAMLKANKSYFDAVAQAFTGNPVTSFKKQRQEAFVALANLSDHFQKMLSEPKFQQHNLQLYHQLVASVHVLTSYVASLSYFAQRTGNRYASKDFEPIVNKVSMQLQLTIDIAEHHKVSQLDIKQTKLPILEKVNELLATRIKEMESGNDDGIQSVRKTLSDLKTITEQFELISTIVTDEIKILQKLAA
ncbi:FUSC family protein [Foetidibacter luteolus]|uniref:FUSC family protein n=1 Tax=Foetidibacter luteolus TaxID=2608880 RepID=UPI00129B2977|nr:FUSC family membrane protein [Foetidibacter luteolus]